MAYPNFIGDLDAQRAIAWIRAGKRARKGAVRRLGVAAMEPGKIPGWWYNLVIKPDPTILFGAPEWPLECNVTFHMARQDLIHQRYKFRSWYPAFARGITWYELCRERENAASLDTKPDTKARPRR